MFPNENFLEGVYTQKVENKENPEPGEKPEIKLEWKTAGNILVSASKVNSTEAASIQ